jgi:hypothetical protein
MRALRLVPRTLVSYRKPRVPRALVRAAQLATWAERRAIERQFGVTFDPKHDGQLLRDRRTK